MPLSAPAIPASRRPSPAVWLVALWLLAACAFPPSPASAQCTVKGVVVDGADASALPGASVVVFRGGADQVGGASSGADGRFAIDSLAAGAYRLHVSFIGYELSNTEINIPRGRNALDVGKITLKPTGKQLDEVTVVRQVQRQEQRGDTTVFNAAAFKVNPDATTEDLLRKMPGMQVKDGQVSHGGEAVKKVLVDGKEFFGSDPSAALKNIDASMVDKIEVFDKQSEQAEFTGFADGNEEKTINIMTKADMRRGVFGRAAAGYGTSDHFESEAIANVFSGNYRVSVVGSFNDVDRQGFSAPGGGGGGGGSTGVNRNGSIGVNYGYEKNKDLRVEASYVFAYRKNRVDGSSLQEYFQSEEADSLHSYTSTTENANVSRAHRVNLRVRWQATPSDMFVISPAFSCQGGSSSSSSSGVDARGSQAYSSTSQTSASDNSSWSLSGGLTWRHKMNLARRTLSASLRASVSKSSASSSSRGGMSSRGGFDPSYAPDTTDIPAAGDNLDGNPPDGLFGGDMAPASTGLDVYGQQTTSDGRTLSLSTRLVYTEPFGDYWGASVNYAPSFSLSSNDKTVLADTVFSMADVASVTFDSLAFSPTLSNDKESRYWTHRAGLAVNFQKSKSIRASAGLDAQYAILSGDQTYPLEFSTRHTFFSLMPSFELSASKGRQMNVKLKYRSQSSAPSISQLQDVVDVSDVRHYSVGNPSLRQSVSHSLSLAAMRTNSETSRSVFLMSNFSVTNGFVASSSVMATSDSTLASGVVLPAGAQLSMPVNLDGQVAASANLTLSTPFSRLGCNAALSLGVNVSKQPGIFNGSRTVSRNSSFNASLSLGSAFSETVDFNVSYNPSYNMVRSSQATQSDYDYYRHSVRADVSTLFLKRHLVLASSAQHNFSKGMGDGFDNDYVTWNAAVAFKFLARRQAEIRLRVNDILNSNQSSSRSVNEAYVQTSSSNVIRRYAMLTFTYKFNENAGRSGSRRDGPPDGGMGGPPPGGGMGGPPPM